MSSTVKPKSDWRNYPMMLRVAAAMFLIGAIAYARLDIVAPAVVATDIAIALLLVTPCAKIIRSMRHGSG